MANEELGRLSPEQIQRLANTISEAKNLTGQQEEIIKKVLSGEEDIGKLRISYLEEYFDIYSRNLDLIARKYNKLNDAFLILDRKLTTSYRTLEETSSKSEEYKNSGATTSRRYKKGAPAPERERVSSEEPQKRNNKEISDLGKAIRDLQNTVKQIGFAANNTGANGNQPKKVSNVRSTVSESQRNELNRTTIKDVLDEVNSKRVQLEAEQEISKSDRLSSLLRTAEHIHDSMLDLAIERLQTTELLEERSTEFRLSKLKEVTDAELAAQSLMNEINTQLEYARSAKGANELGGMRAAQVKATEEEKSLQELKQQLDEKRIQLEYEARAQHNGRLLKKDAAAIEKQLSEEFTQRKKKLNELTAERFKKEKQLNDLARLKEVDPKLAHSIEKKMADRKEELEHEARAKHSGRLLQADSKRIEKELQKEFSLSEKNIKALAAQDFAEEKLQADDPELAAAREAKIKKEIADEEFKYREEHEGQLTEEARREIRRQAEEKYKLDKKNLERINELTAEFMHKQRLARLKESDATLASDVEKQMAEMRANLEYEARSRNNGMLLQEDIDDIKQKLEAEFNLSEANIRKLAAKRWKVEKLKQDDPKAAQALEERRAKFIAAEELKARLNNNGKLTKKERDNIKKLAEEKLGYDRKNLDKIAKDQLKKAQEEKKARVAETDKTISHAVDFASLSKEDNLLSRMEDLKAIVDDADDGKKFGASLAVATKLISSLAQQLEGTVNKIASYKGEIDTRLQGSKNETANGIQGKSYWDRLTKDMMSVGAVTPYFKQEKFAENIKSLVEKGISFDLKQRAFLMTIQEKIANTFNVADGTLLRLIRIQQEDSTAGRLGMESALNSFLNNMYETTEYLTDVAASVRGSLEEMESLMSGAAATEVEYQVQKWMGSLYSVGMSQNAVTAISTALGQIASGQVDALTNGGTGNLLVMAANSAGIPISDILATGLNAEETNKLLQATVNYLAEIAASSKNNQVVQQQLAGVFGIKASDLKAAANLAISNKSVFGEYKTYDNMLDQLNKMAGSMYQRTSIGEMMTNIWENGQYTLAGSMASSPMAYLTYKMASLLDATTGGIAIPAISAFGNMVDLETTVADLMRVGALGTGILGSIGPMASGLASSFSGRAMLTKMGIESGSGLKVNIRGSDTGGIGATESLTGGGATSTSGSGFAYVGNASGSDVLSSTLSGAEDTKKKLMVEAKEQEADAPVHVINTNVLKIYELLDDVASGKSSFTVKVSGYGLTKTGNSTSLSSAQGGVAGLLSNSPAGADSGFSSSSSGTTASAGSSTTGGASSSGSSFGNSTGNSAFGLGSSVDLGGWVMT